MIDREKVITALECCKDVHQSGRWASGCISCGYSDKHRPDCFLRLADDAVELLKEQEAIKPTINEYGKAYCICGENVGIIPSSKSLPKVCSKYCSECGRKMKWDSLQRIGGSANEQAATLQPAG